MKPKPKKKPFRITKPGLYRTRDGRMAFVASVFPDNPLPVFGLVENERTPDLWHETGRYTSNCKCSYDLISRWPGKKARRERDIIAKDAGGGYMHRRLTHEIKALRAKLEETK